MIGGWTLLFAVAATAAGLWAPERMRLMVPVTSSLSVGEIVFPFGHWFAVAVWSAGVWWLHPADRRLAVRRCIGIGAALHALLLVALFVPRLSDREAFSASVYLIYARIFCAAVTAAATAWLLAWVGRVRDQRPLAVLETPSAIAWLALVIALTRYNLPMAIASLIGGVMLFAATRWARRESTRQLTARLPAIIDNDRAFVAVVFVIALVLRLIYVTRIMSDANYLDAGADGRVYDQLAWSIATGAGVPDWFSTRFPLLLLGYVYFVAAVYTIAGHSYVAVTAVQALLGATACVLLYDLARGLFGRTVARVAAAFASVSFPLLFAAATIGHQALDVFLTVFIAWLAMRLVAMKGSAWRWTGLGVTVGFAFAVRETNIFLAVCVGAWIAFANQDGWRRAAPQLAAYAFGAAIVVLPFLAPKIWTADDRAAMRGHFDRLYRGEGEVRATPRTEIVGPLADPRGALAQLQSEPARVIGTLTKAYATNIAVQFLTQPYGGFDLVFLRKGSEYYYGMWFYAYALTVAGTIVLLQRSRLGGLVAAGTALILGVIASRTFPHVILESDYRHRVPVEPFLILLASIGVVMLFRAVMATATSASTSGLTGNDWRVSHSSGTWTPVT